MSQARRALVLGGGGVVGTAWMAGLASGLRREGVDLTDADVIVGTSAGAIVGTILATGQNLDDLDLRPRPAELDDSAPSPDPSRVAEVFATLRDTSLELADARRAVGRLALSAQTISEQQHIAVIGTLLVAGEWPDRELLVTAVNVETGELKVWDRASGAPLLNAVASSCSLPGVAPPITIDGQRYMDGGIGSGTNADLAAGATGVVVVEPLAHLFPREPLERELAATGADTSVTISPDDSALKAFGRDLGDWAAWPSSWRAGVNQAGGVAERVRAAWRLEDSAIPGKELP